MLGPWLGLLHCKSIENHQFYFALVPTPEAPKTPLSPEPKLMSDNVATMSLLSASECHLAALQDEDGDT